MIANKLNTVLIEAVRSKLPLQDSLAKTLMDILYIGKEAVYRRLRGEVPFTLSEASIISRRLGISLDQVVGVTCNNNAVFDMNIVHHKHPFDTYYSIIDKYVKVIHMLKEDQSSELGSSSNIIPQTLYLKYSALSKFRLFKWMYQNENIVCKHFDEMEIPSKLIGKQKEFAGLIQHVRFTDYILDHLIFQHMINDIQYFASVNLISEADKKTLKEELFQLADDLEELAGKGKSEADNIVRIYISNVNIEATYSYMETNSLQLSMIRIYGISSITSQDQGMFNSLKNWILSLKKFSTLISESGELQRIHFFKKQREIIATL